MIIYIWHEHDFFSVESLIIVLLISKFGINVCSARAVLWIIISTTDTQPSTEDCNMYDVNDVYVGIRLKMLIMFLIIIDLLISGE